VHITHTEELASSPTDLCELREWLAGTHDAHTAYIEREQDATGVRFCSAVTAVLPWKIIAASASFIVPYFHVINLQRSVFG